MSQQTLRFRHLLEKGDAYYRNPKNGRKKHGLSLRAWTTYHKISLGFTRDVFLVDFFSSEIWSDSQVTAEATFKFI